MTDDELLDWADFVANKFQSNREGWIYTRDTGDLKHIRYGRDSTGYNSFWKRLKRAFQPKMHFTSGFMHKPSLSWSRAWVSVSLRKDDNKPDGVLNGGSIITHWEEDGEYIMLMGPTVGSIVLDFVRQNRDNDLSKAVLAEMRRLAEISKSKEVSE